MIITFPLLFSLLLLPQTAYSAMAPENMRCDDIAEWAMSPGGAEPMISEEKQQFLDNAFKNLGADEFDLRERASDYLLREGFFSRSRLKGKEGLLSTDAEVRRRAEELIDYHQTRLFDCLPQLMAADCMDQISPSFIDTVVREFLVSQFIPRFKLYRSSQISADSFILTVKRLSRLLNNDVFFDRCANASDHCEVFDLQTRAENLFDLVFEEMNKKDFKFEFIDEKHNGTFDRHAVMKNDKLHQPTATFTYRKAIEDEKEVYSFIWYWYVQTSEDAATGVPMLQGRYVVGQNLSQLDQGVLGVDYQTSIYESMPHVQSEGTAETEEFSVSEQERDLAEANDVTYSSLWTESPGDTVSLANQTQMPELMSTTATSLEEPPVSLSIDDPALIAAWR